MANKDLYKKYRECIVGINTKVPISGGRQVEYINFDNAATTPSFVSVLDTVCEFARWYSSVHRGMGYKSQLTSEIYERVREKVLNFVGADKNKYTVIFVKNATEALNKLSYRLIKSKDDVVLSTFMEHHSNDLPWRDKCVIDYIDVDKDGMLSVVSLLEKLEKHKGKVKIVTIAGASNVTGYKNDICKIANIVHRHGAKIVVDAAQLVAHSKIKMCQDDSSSNIDFLVFSGHKMYAPFGTGAIVGLKDAFKDGMPEYVGGGNVKLVTHDYLVFDMPPNKEEAGSPNVLGAIAIEAAIHQLEKFNMRQIELREKEILDYAISKMLNIDGVTLYGKNQNVDKVGIYVFNIEDINHEIVAEKLSKDYGIAVRSGWFCAHPYTMKLLDLSKDDIDTIKNNLDDYVPGLIRVSMGIYNTKKEVDRLIEAIYKIKSQK